MEPISTYYTTDFDGYVAGVTTVAFCCAATYDVARLILREAIEEKCGKVVDPNFIVGKLTYGEAFVVPGDF